MRLWVDSDFNKLWVCACNSIQIRLHRWYFFCGKIWQVFSWRIFPSLRKWLISTYLMPMLHFYTPWKPQKTFGFLAFSRGIEINISAKLVRLGITLQPCNKPINQIVLYSKNIFDSNANKKILLFESIQT